MKLVCCNDLVFNQYSMLFPEHRADLIYTRVDFSGNRMNPIEEICHIIYEISRTEFIDGPFFEEALAGAILNTEEAFFELYDLVHKFYNGFDVFIVFEECEFFEVAVETLCSIITNLFGIVPPIIYSLEDLDMVEHTIGFTEAGLQYYSMHRPYYHQLLAKRMDTPLARFDIGNYTSILQEGGKGYGE